MGSAVDPSVRPPPGAMVKLREVARSHPHIPVGTTGRVVRTAGRRVLVAFPPEERYWLDLDDLDWWQAPVDRNLRMVSVLVESNHG